MDKKLLTMFLVALGAIWVANNVQAVGNIVR